MTTTSGKRVPTAEMSALLLANAAATLFMCGLIWFVQVVHYPLLAHVGGHRPGPGPRARVGREGAAAVPALVAGNWVQTTLWTARAGVVLALLATAH